MAAADVCIICNPAAGRGRASRALESLRSRFGPGTEVRPTTGPGHAEELAREAARSGFAGVAAAGGDGTVHEVANGLLRAQRPDVVLHVLPIGSANDYAWCLDREGARDNIRRVDVGLARRDDGRERYFINCMGVGFNGAVTREARRIRWLRGIPLYAWALLRTLFLNYRAPLMEVTLDAHTRKTPTLALSINLGRREGNLLLTSSALLTDGAFDYMHAADLRRWELIRYMPAMVTGNLPTNHPKLWTGRCHEASVLSETPLIVHLDGEFLCLPEDNTHRVEARLLPAALAVCTHAPAA